jgi:hypothetical protein
MVGLRIEFKSVDYQTLDDPSQGPVATYWATFMVEYDPWAARVSLNLLDKAEQPYRDMWDSDCPNQAMVNLVNREVWRAASLALTRLNHVIDDALIDLEKPTA